MSEYLSVFRSKSGEELVLKAYNRLIALWGIPYEELYIDTTLGKTHIIVTGQSDSPPLILIHAFYASAASWYRNVRSLSEKFRVYAIDIIGDPNKSKPLKPIRQTSCYVNWFKEILDRLKIDRCDFVGNSVGAFHVANFALNEPDRVKSMTLIGPAATFINIPKFYIHTFPGGMTGWGFMVRHAVNWIENGSPFDSEFKSLFYLLLKHGKSANQVFPAVMTDEQLKQISIPTLLIYGEKEVIYDYSSAVQRAQKNLQKLSVEIIPGANHITGASRPELTNESILKFLSTTS
jgi:pimeloyl-ACP methyl ester carboxylesterase